MSKIDDLIKQYCPNGVEYDIIKNICNISRGRVMSKEYLRDNIGEYPVYSSQTVNEGILGKIDTYDYDGEYLTWTTDGANAGSIFYRTGKFSITNVCGLLKITNNKVNTKFLHYYLGTVAKNYVNVGMGNPKLMSNVMATIKVAIPPLPVQEEIVRVLDIFTALEAELEAELEARKRQYEYYRNKLLTFDENTTGGGIEWKILSEIILSLKTGLNPRKFFKLNTSDANNYYVTIKEIQNNTIIISDKTDKINDVALTLCQNRSKLEVGDILFSGTGTIGETAVIETPPTNWNIKEGVYAIKPNHKYIMSRFLMHLFHSENIRNAIFRKVVGGIVKSIPMNEIGKIIIPVPPLPEQERIVAILDKFDSLVNDISEGLPAELTARRQQYEYYRNKLLTFEEAA